MDALLLVYEMCFLPFLVHPCDKADKGGCAHICTKKGDYRFICQCRKGYKLDKDFRECNRSK